MSDPQRYTQSYDFSGFQETFPSTPLPGLQLDIQLADIATSTNSLRNAIMDVRRSDGKLKNGIVTADSLSASLSLGFTLRGNWADATAYAAGDGVVYDDTFYKALAAHTSSSGSRPDLDSTTWEFLFTMAAIAVSDESITPAKLESSQGEAFHAKLDTAARLGPIVSALADKSTPVGEDLVAITDSEAAAASKKLTLTNLAAWLFSGLGALISAATAKSTPVDADTFLLSDSAASGASKKVTVAALKTAVAPIGQQAIFVPAAAMSPAKANGAAPASEETTTNKVLRRTLDFDASIEEFAQFGVQMPKGWNEGTLVAQFIWSHGSTTTNFGVVWGIEAVAFGDSDALDTAWGTEVATVDTGGTTDDIFISPESTAITVAGSPGNEEYVMFRITRVVGNASDTMAVDARLHGVKIHYTTSAATDD